jgi:hypothetical protein
VTPYAKPKYSQLIFSGKIRMEMPATDPLNYAETGKYNGCIGWFILLPAADFENTSQSVGTEFIRDFRTVKFKNEQWL